MTAVEDSDGKAGVKIYRLAANAPRVPSTNESSAATVRSAAKDGHAFQEDLLRPLGSAHRSINTDVAVGARGDAVGGPNVRVRSPRRAR